MLNPVSREPSALSLLTPGSDPSDELNSPPTTIFPSGWIAIEVTHAPTPNAEKRLDVWNDGSTLPSGFSRVRPGAAVTLHDEKIPPTSNFPSACSSTA